MPKVSLFIPCFVDQLMPQVGLDMATVLRRVGYDVTFPEVQTCCGQPGFNSGYWNDARPLAERFLRVFHDAELIVSPSGSCTTSFQWPCTLMPSPPGLAGAGASFSSAAARVAGGCAFDKGQHQLALREVPAEMKFRAGNSSC